MRVNYVIVFVSDMQRSVQFYRDVLGLPLRFESSEWTEFSTAGATIALHVSDSPNPDNSNETQTNAGRCRPGFCLSDLDSFHQRMLEKNVICTQQPKDVFAARIAQYLDPDGLALSASEKRNDQKYWCTANHRNPFSWSCPAPRNYPDGCSTALTKFPHAAFGNLMTLLMSSSFGDRTG